MHDEPYAKLSRREREMMDVIYARGRATAAEIRAAMSSPPSYSAVRATLRVLEEKGQLRHEHDGATYVFMATTPKDTASRSALRRLLATFFDGSPSRAMAALLDVSSTRLSKADRRRLLELIRAAEKEGR